MNLKGFSVYFLRRIFTCFVTLFYFCHFSEQKWHVSAEGDETNSANPWIMIVNRQQLCLWRMFSLSCSNTNISKWEKTKLSIQCFLEFLNLICKPFFHMKPNESLLVLNVSKIIKFLILIFSLWV